MVDISVLFSSSLVFDSEASIALQLNIFHAKESWGYDRTHFAVLHHSSCHLQGFSPLIHTHFGVCLCLALRHELWINHRRESHSTETKPPVGNRREHSHYSIQYTNQFNKLSSPPLCQIATQCCAKIKKEMCETQTLVSPWRFSLTVALLSLPVNHPEWHVETSHPISQRYQPVLLTFTQWFVSAGVWFYCSIVNNRVEWEGYSHLLTHGQLCTAWWDIISQNVED